MDLKQRTFQIEIAMEDLTISTTLCLAPNSFLSFQNMPLPLLYCQQMLRSKDVRKIKQTCLI